MSECHGDNLSLFQSGRIDAPTKSQSSRLSSTENSAPLMYKEGMTPELNYQEMLAVALAEARKGLAEGGIPIGAAIFDAGGQLIGAGHNRRVQHGDPSMHGETDAFRNAGRQRSYRQLIMVTTLAPAGTVADWFGSLASEPSWWAKAATSRADSIGCARWA